MSLGEPRHMLDADARVTGRLPYGINLKWPDMLVAKVFRSQVPHARISDIDVEQARALPGVEAVLQASDFDAWPGSSLTYGLRVADQPVVASDRVRYIGEPLAVVVAKDPAAAQAALDVIQVAYDELPAVFDPVAARQPDAPQLHEGKEDNCLVHAKIRHGDLEAGFELADVILEETYTSPVAQHASLEPHVAAAQWEDGALTVWSAAQAPYTVQKALMSIFGLESDAVRVIVPPLGGGYGGKGHIRIEPLVAAAARLVPGRVVKLVLSRPEEFVTVTKHAAVITIKSGARKDGTLTARQVTLHWNAGAYADASPILVPAGMVRSVGPYRIPAVHVDSYGIYTNLPPAAAFRGAMSSQTTWAYESHMDSLAHRLGMDPIALRRMNVLRSGDTFATGETMHDVHFAECLDSVVEALGWETAGRSQGSGTLRRGQGAAVMMKSTVPTSRSECRLALDDGGQLSLFTSTVEMGQGAHTALAQIAADSLAMDLGAVHVIGPDTRSTPFDSTTSASRSTSMMGQAVLQAAEALASQLLDLASPLLETPAADLALEAGRVIPKKQDDEGMDYAEVLGRHQRKTIVAEGTHATKGGLDPETGQGVASPHWHQGAGACEVEVDTATGKVRVLRYRAASYAGRVVNPTLAKLQNDGNVIFGLGPTLMEEVVFDGGQIINPNLSDYMIPSILDIPQDMESQLLETPGAEFHGIGEMTLPPVAPAVANAIFDAVGIRIRDLPLSPERVLRALRELTETGGDQ